MTGIKRRNRTEREWNLAVTILERVGFAHVDQVTWVEVFHVIRRYLGLTERSLPGSLEAKVPPLQRKSQGPICEVKHRTSQAFWTEICFPEKQRRLTGENIPGAWLMFVTTRASLQKPPHPLPKQCENVEVAAQDSGKETTKRYLSQTVSEQLLR